MNVTIEGTLTKGDKTLGYEAEIYRPRCKRRPLEYDDVEVSRVLFKGEDITRFLESLNVDLCELFDEITNEIVDNDR